MKEIDLATTVHDFQKVKSVLNEDGTKKYSIYMCPLCKLRGKRYPHTVVVQISSEYDHYHITHCFNNLNEDEYVGKFIQITSTSNLKKERIEYESVHKIVTPPLPYVNGNGGIWIAFPHKIKVLFGDFEFHTPMKRTK